MTRANMDPISFDKTFEVTFNEYEGDRSLTIVVQAGDSASTDL